eukprot:6183083-Pleurochrysis_carterae.AAC.3
MQSAWSFARLQPVARARLAEGHVLHLVRDAVLHLCQSIVAVLTATLKSRRKRPVNVERMVAGKAGCGHHVHLGCTSRAS